MTVGKLLVCDGSNGAGKTTILEEISKYLTNTNKNFITTREPGGTPIGEKLREIVLDKNNSDMCDMTELMLFSAARAQHLNELILPALQSGVNVISDRFESATVSFQHYARGLPINVINQLNNLALGDFRPDMTIVLDLDPVIGLERVHGRGQGLDRMENVDIGFLEKARDGYLKQAKMFPERFTVVDASKSLENVVSEVLLVVDKVVK